MSETANILAFPMHRVRQRAADGFPPGWPAGPVGEQMEKLARMVMARSLRKGTDVSLEDCRASIYAVVYETRLCNG